MTNEQDKLIDEFGKIAKKIPLCYNIIFTAGAIAFEEGTTDEESTIRLKKLIEFAKESKTENDFVAKIKKTYID